MDEKTINRLIVSAYYNKARDIMPWEKGYDEYCKKLIEEMKMNQQKEVED